MDNPPEALVALLGLDLPADRREAVLAAFATIAGEIAKLRRADAFTDRPGGAGFGADRAA